MTKKNIFSFIVSSINPSEDILEYHTSREYQKNGNYKINCRSCGEFSCVLNTKKHFTYCFNCETGGDIFTYYSKVFNIPIIDAAYMIAHRHALNIPEELQISCNN